MEENKRYKKYWYAVRILHNRVEACVELLDAINGNPREMLPVFLNLPEDWTEADWQSVEYYPRPERISVRAGGKRIHRSVPLISSLLFIHTTASQIKMLGQIFGTKARIYTHLSKKKLTKVHVESVTTEEGSDTEFVEVTPSEQPIEWYKEVIQPVKILPHEIETLKVVLSHGAEGVIPISPEKLKWGKGTKVRVIDGEFKGWEGEIRRIKCKTRLVVSIRDIHQRTVASFCVTTYIPACFLQEITE